MIACLVTAVTLPLPRAARMLDVASQMSRARCRALPPRMLDVASQIEAFIKTPEIQAALAEPWADSWAEDDDEVQDFEKMLDKVGFRYDNMTDNEAYQLFLGQGNARSS